MLTGIRNVKSLITVFFYDMCCFVMFITAVCILFPLTSCTQESESIAVNSVFSLPDATGVCYNVIFYRDE